MKVVVTGGAGFIGSHLVDSLVEKSIHEIWVLDNFYRGSINNLHHQIRDKRIHLTEGDIRDKELLSYLFEGTDIVFHLAAQANVLGAVQDMDYSFSTNVIGTYNVLNMAKKKGIKRIVFTSSREVYGEPLSLPVLENEPLMPKNAYGASKVAGEAYCQAFVDPGFDVVVLRLANVYGPRDVDRVIPCFINAIANKEPIVVYGETKILDFVWIGDVVRALVQSGFCEYQIDNPINIGSGKGTLLSDLAKRLKDLMNSDVEVIVAQPRDLEVGSFVADIQRMQSTFWGSREVVEPLGHLEDVVHYWRNRLDE